MSFEIRLCIAALVFICGVCVPLRVLIKTDFFVTENASRKRVQTMLKDFSLTPKERVLFLDNEMNRLMGSMFNTEAWRKEVRYLALMILEENNLSVTDLYK